MRGRDRRVALEDQGFIDIAQPLTVKNPFKVLILFQHIHINKIFEHHTNTPIIPFSFLPRQISRNTITSTSGVVTSAVMSTTSKVLPVAPDGGNPAWPSARQLETLMTEREMSSLKALEGLQDPSVQGVASMLGVDTATGLSETDLAGIETRKAHFGPNSFEAKPPTWLLQFWWDAMHDSAIITLCVMAVVTICVWFFVEKDCNPMGFLEPVALIF